MSNNENLMVVKDKNGNDVSIPIPQTPQPQIIMEFSSKQDTTNNNTNNTENDNK